MKTVYVYLLIGIIAIALMTVIVFNYDPNTETLSSLLLGGLLGFLLYRRVKSRRQKSTK